MKGNAKIKSTSLGYEDHGILTCFLHLEQQGVGQGFGGYRLDAPNGGDSEMGTFWIQRILSVVDVQRWEDVVGKYVRVEGEEFGDIFGIGHITHNIWFFPKKEIAERFGAK